MKCFICKQGEEKEPLIKIKDNHFIQGVVHYHSKCIDIYNVEMVQFITSFIAYNPSCIGKPYSTEMMEEIIKKIKTRNYDENSIIEFDSIPITLTIGSRYDYSIESVKQQEETEESLPKAAQFKRDKFDRLKQRNAKLASVSKFFKHF